MLAQRHYCDRKPMLQSKAYVMLHAEFLDYYEAKLTAGYSQTYTSGQNAGVTVSTQQGQHATVTAGKLLNLSNTGACSYCLVASVASIWASLCKSIVTYATSC